MKRLAAFLLVLLISGCVASYQAPQVHQVEKERVYSKTPDQVWDKVVEWFALHASPVKNMDRSSGFIASEYNLSIEDYPQYSDCGSTTASMMQAIAITSPTGNFNILIRKTADDKVRVVVTAAFHAKTVATGQYGGGTDIECTSRGVLEKQLLDFIDK